MIGTYKIIIIDDNQTFLEGLESLLLKRSDFKVLARHTSGEGLLNDPGLGYADLILLDIEMPGISGITTAQRVNFHHPQIKSIAITMYQDQIYLQQLIEAGFKGFVNKTMVGENLFSVIDEVLENKFSFPLDMEIKD